MYKAQNQFPNQAQRFLNLEKMCPNQNQPLNLEIWKTKLTPTPKEPTKTYFNCQN
jgi:hypothetical protein